VLRAFLLLVWYLSFHMNNTFTRFFSLFARCFCCSFAFALLLITIFILNLISVAVVVAQL